MDYTYDRPAPGDTEALSEILAWAFGTSAPDMVPWLDKIGRDNLRVVREKDRVVAQLGIVWMGQFFGDRSVPMAGIAAVGTVPDGGRHEIRVQASSIDIKDRELAVEAVDLADTTTRADIEATYKKRAAGRMGNLDRGDYIWNRIFAPKGEPPRAARRLLSLMADHKSLASDFVWHGSTADPLRPARDTTIAGFCEGPDKDLDMAGELFAGSTPFMSDMF